MDAVQKNNIMSVSHIPSPEPHRIESRDVSLPYYSSVLIRKVLSFCIELDATFLM